ncbi:MAG: glutathione S-transferase family protein [Saccharospirillum sp.]|nr:glutathione S-transferase family protein [Saccharospirillum sp.]
MNNLTLIIGNKNYSSWSLRAWLLLRAFGVHFKEIRIPLDSPETPELLAKYSPSKKVPVLQIGHFKVWDSLAIAETVNERYLQGAGWPKDPDLRALGRAACAEMHSGFSALRASMPMNCRREISGFQPNSATAADIARIDSLLNECLTSSEGPYLMGEHFSIADAFFAPVAYRLQGYQVSVSEPVSAWIRHLFHLPALQAWHSEACAESEIIETEEVADG